ncbi:MAG: sulfatase [Pirellulales bacterium]|nr:sulfatase [Pirellulales bacterium]
MSIVFATHPRRAKLWWKSAPVVFLFLLSALASHAGPADGGTAKPNVLFIAVDDLRPELGCYGNRTIKSPNIDRLADGGVTFTRAYCQSALCNPSRASLLTGLRPDAIRVWDLYTDFRDTCPRVVTLPQCFKQQGYHAVAIGKVFHNTKPDAASWSEPKLYVPGYPFDPDAVYRKKENLARLAERRREIIASGEKDKHIDRFGEWYLKTAATECADVPDDAYYDGAQTTMALEKLAELKRRDEPFFFAVGYYRPHLPFNAPKKYWDLYDRDKIPLAQNDFVPKDAPIMAVNNMRELRSYEDFFGTPRPDQGPLSETQARLLRHGYYASVSYTDAQVGRLLDGLDRLGLAENTIVVLWGDHGWKLGEHRSWCKMTNFEIDCRAPLIIRVPRAKEKGKTCAALVEFVDVYPTLCDLAGVTPPEGLAGQSVTRLLEDATRPGKSAALSQFLRFKKWTAPDGVVYMGYTIRTPRWRLVEWYPWDETKQIRGRLAARELYDHENAPEENVNVAGLPENQTIIERLSRHLAAGFGMKSD